MVDGGGELGVEGAVLADLDAVAVLGDAVEPDGVGVEFGVVADGAGGGVVGGVGGGGGDGPGVGAMKEVVAVGAEGVDVGVALGGVLDAAV